MDVEQLSQGRAIEPLNCLSLELERLTILRCMKNTFILKNSQKMQYSDEKMTDLVFVMKTQQ